MQRDAARCGTLVAALLAAACTPNRDGRQYVVIATSNARNPAAPQGGAYVAYRLPD